MLEWQRNMQHYFTWVVPGEIRADIYERENGTWLWTIAKHSHPIGYSGPEHSGIASRLDAAQQACELASLEYKP